MKRTIAGIAVVAALLTGCGADAQATTEKHEDSPGWNCWVDGNKVCGGNPIERTEAWGRFSPESIPADVRAQAFKVTYLGLALEGVDFPPSEYLTVPSAVTPGKSHVFMVEGR